MVMRGMSHCWPVEDEEPTQNEMLFDLSHAGNVWSIYSKSCPGIAEHDNSRPGFHEDTAEHDSSTPRFHELPWLNCCKTA